MILLILLLVKHFILDFYYQPPFMWQNKGTYGHIGGIVHAGLHALATAAIFSIFGFPINIFLGVALIEFVLHYHIDWAKMNINRAKGWACNTHNEFWQLTGLDQLLHQLTYVLILWIAYNA